MNWAAGYHDSHEHRDDSGETTGEALTWLLDELDQRAMVVEADLNRDPAASADEIDELRAAWRYFRELPHEMGGVHRAGCLVFWLACDDDRPQSLAAMLQRAWLRRRRPVKHDDLAHLQARVAELQQQAGPQ